MKSIHEIRGLYIILKKDLALIQFIALQSNMCEMI